MRKKMIGWKKDGRMSDCWVKKLACEKMKRKKS